MNNTPWTYWLVGLVITIIATYSPRIIPLALLKKKIESPFLVSFLHYMPYAVLGAMTFPAILFSTPNQISAIAGMLTALIASFLGLKLLPVSLISVAFVLIAEFMLRFFR